jgi:dihydrofolate synthase/folylpolyglutamate synthase
MNGPPSAYASALRYLYSFADYERDRPRARDEMHLAGITALLSELGDPHVRLRAVHVAGSKGKGSTSAMLSSTLAAAGCSVGFYSSPHLHTHRERYRLNGEPVGEEEFTSLLHELRPAIEQVRRRLHLTTYEVSTALMFELFARRGVEWSVIEVGLGGRLDATNVLSPELSVITPISLEHTEVLGDTVGAIAREKAGIVKPGRPVVIAPQPAEALEAILERCRESGSPALQVANELGARDRMVDGWQAQEFKLATSLSLPDAPLDRVGIRLGLLGAHQVTNALTAIGALTVLAAAGAPIGLASLLEGLATVRWPGRLEVVPGQPPVVVDGAHNPDSVAKLRAAVRELFGEAKAVWVIATGADKDAEGIMRALRGVSVILTRTRHPRAMPVDRLSAAAEAARLGSANEPGVAEALEAARGAGAAVVVACGSVFAAAEAREALGLARATDPVGS